MALPAKNLDTHLSSQELRRDPDAALERARHGETLVIEEQGKPRIAMVDLTDLRLLRAASSRYPIAEGEADTPAEGEALEGQALYDAVVTQYFAESISLSRAAELLAMTWLELRERLHRLGITTLPTPSDTEELAEDLKAARWAASS